MVDNDLLSHEKFQGEYDQRFVVNKGDLLIGMDGIYLRMKVERMSHRILRSRSL